MELDRPRKQPASYSCEYCNIDWPFQSNYLFCPQCHKKCEQTHEEPMESMRAIMLANKIRQERKNREDFERYYEARAVTELQRDMDAWATCPLVC